MSILGRVADLFQAKTNKLLNAIEDPNDTLDLSYEKMLTGLQDTKRHLADVVAQQKSLERQIASSDTEMAGAEPELDPWARASKWVIASEPWRPRRPSPPRRPAGSSTGAGTGPPRNSPRSSPT